jgi:Zn-dependent M28 family amino/carboxypeptidase
MIMTNILRAAASMLALTLSTTTLAQTAARKPPAPAPQINVETLKSITEELSSDAYEGRAPGTVGEEKTIALLAKKFETAGLKPGNKGSWYQDVPIVEILADPAMQMFISKPGSTDAAAGIMLNYKTDFVAGTYRQAEKIDVKSSEMVFVGYGINAPEKGWNDYAGVDVKGKTVVILINDPDYETKTLTGPFGGRAMTYYGRWTYKYEEAARQGAAAAIIVHDTFPAAYPWGVVVSSWTGPQVHIDSKLKGMDQTMANGWMTNEAATKLMAASGQNLTALTAAAKRKGFKAVPLGLTADLSINNTIKRSNSKNVIGILPGKTRPKDVVMYSAHWDHLGRCEAQDGDDICNGAVDNASGTAALVALAEAHSKAGAPARSLVFLAVTAEESGLLGSKYYAENPVYPLNQTVGGINMDGLNVLGRTKDVVIIGEGKSELEPILKRHIAKQGRVLTPEATPEKGFFYRSDHFSFAKLGVPMIYFDSGEDFRIGGKAAGTKAAEDYTVNRYHKPSDEYDPKWDWSGAVEDLRLNYQIGRELANGAVWPNWYTTSEFRAIRDKSRGVMPIPLKKRQ